jgi:hypothetical protein
MLSDRDSQSVESPRSDGAMPADASAVLEAACDKRSGNMCLPPAKLKAIERRVDHQVRDLKSIMTG